MNRTKSKQQRAARRAEIYRRYVTGETQPAIAVALGISQPVVCEYIAQARAEVWQETAERKTDRLAELERLRLEAWLAWGRSQQDSEIETVERIEGGAGEDGEAAWSRLKTVKRREGQAGDASFLQQVQKAIEQERVLIGLDAPRKIAPTDPTGENEYAGASERFLARILEALGRWEAGGDSEGPE